MRRADLREMRLVCKRLLEVMSPLRNATRDLGDVILALGSRAEQAEFREDWARLTQLTADVAKEAAEVGSLLNRAGLN